MGLIVRLFFIMIITSIVLSAALGWVAIARAKMQLGKIFSKRDAQMSEEKPANVIEGEYRVLSEEDNTK